jgi:hypothetical protein
VAGSDNGYLYDRGKSIAQALRLDKEKMDNDSVELEQKNNDKIIKGLPKIQNTLRISALIELFSVAEQPDSDNPVPSGVIEAKKIWDAGVCKISDHIVDLIKPYVACSFVAGNIDDWRRLIRDENDGEFEASEISITDVDFADCPLPLLSLTCIFALPLASSVSAEDVMSELEDDCWGWGSCIIPRWEFPTSVGSEDLDLTIGEHNSIEVSIFN